MGFSRIIDHVRTSEVVGADEARIQEQARTTKIPLMAMEGQKGTGGSP